MNFFIKSLLVICAMLTGMSLSAAKPNVNNENNMKSLIIYFTHSNNTGLAAKRRTSRNKDFP